MDVLFCVCLVDIDSTFSLNFQQSLIKNRVFSNAQPHDFTMRSRGDWGALLPNKKTPVDSHRHCLQGIEMLMNTRMIPALLNGIISCMISKRTRHPCCGAYEVPFMKGCLPGNS